MGFSLDLSRPLWEALLVDLMNYKNISLALMLIEREREERRLLDFQEFHEKKDCTLACVLMTVLRVTGVLGRSAPLADETIVNLRFFSETLYMCRVLILISKTRVKWG